MTTPIDFVKEAASSVKEFPDDIRRLAFRFLLRNENKPTCNEETSHHLSEVDKELFACARAEYTELRGEINERIGLQNAGLQRVLSLFGITATISVAFFAAIVRTRTSTASDVILTHGEIVILGKALSVLAWVFSLITLLLICNWVYHLWLIFRIHEYIAWLARSIEAVHPSSRELLFRYARHDLDQPWSTIYDKKQFRYLQVLVLYMFALFSLLALVVLAGSLWSDASILERVIGIVSCTVNLTGLVIVGVIHVNLHHVAEHTTELP